MHRGGPEGNTSSTKVEGRRGETGELSFELGLKCGPG